MLYRDRFNIGRCPLLAQGHRRGLLWHSNDICPGYDGRFPALAFVDQADLCRARLTRLKAIFDV